MSELDSFLKIKRIKAFQPGDQGFASYLYNNLNRFTQSDRPDLILENILSTKGNIGIEHTEISVFKEGKKGAQIKRSLRDLKKEIIKIDLEYMEISLIDIQPHYKKKLSLDDGRTFINNIVNSINSKTKKARKYIKFDSNIIWLDVEEFVIFHPTLLFNSRIKNALKDSGFDSILIGSGEELYYFDIKRLIDTNIYSNEKLTINTIKELSQTYKALKSIEPRFHISSGLANISENITENYISHIKLVFEESVVFSSVTRFFANNIELSVLANEKGSDGRIIRVELDKMTFEYELLKDQINMNHRLYLKKGDTFNSDIADKKSSNLQQCLTGVINIIIQENNVIEHYKYIPSFSDLRNMKIKELSI